MKQQTKKATDERVEEREDTDSDDEQEEAGGGAPSEPAPAVGAKRKKKKSLMKRAPEAPKRAKTAYIIFSCAKQAKVRAHLPTDVKVTEAMKVIAEMWRNLTPERKAEWERKAAEDKQRYNDEMANYDGPLQVPNVRPKKDPTQPKQPLSAFIHFMMVERPRLKAQHPEAKGNDISKLLGAQWAKMSTADREPYQELARLDSERYRAEMEQWHLEHPSVAPPPAAAAAAAAAADSEPDSEG